MHDNLAIFSDSQAITASAASTKSFSFMPFTGQGEPVKLDFKVVEAFNTLTSLKVDIEQTAEADTDFSEAEVVSSQTILLADLVVGKRIFTRFLPNIDKPLVRFNYTVAGTPPTTGKVFAAIVVGEDYPIKDGLYFDPRNPTGAASTA